MIVILILSNLIFIAAHQCGESIPGYDTRVQATDSAGRSVYTTAVESAHLFPTNGYTMICCWTRKSHPNDICSTARPDTHSRLDRRSSTRRPPTNRSAQSQTTTPNPIRASTLTSDTTQIIVDRNDLVVTSFAAVKNIDMKAILRTGSLKVSFKNEIGQDYGGLLTEWISSLSRVVFSSSYFKYSENNLLSPAPDKKAKEWYEFFGKILALALRFKKPIGVNFSPSVLKVLVGETLSVADLKTVDPEYYSSLMNFVNDKNLVDSGDFFFVASNTKGQSVDLIPNGSRKVVTWENRHLYISKLAKYKLIDCMLESLLAMKKGFNSMWREEAVKQNLSSAHFGSLLLGETRISMTQFSQNVYYDDNSPEFANLMARFWRVVKTFTQEERKKLIKFIIGTETLPLGGFAGLPRRITMKHSHTSSNHLPTASTCGLVFKLPPYKDEFVMKEKILQAINGVNTFEFV